MKYELTITVSDGVAKLIEFWLSDNQNGEMTLPEEETFTRTAVFPCGYAMDVKCCGSDDGPAWTEAVLFLNGSEVCCTDPEDTYLGRWELEHDGNTYVVNVVCEETICIDEKESGSMITFMMNESDFAYVAAALNNQAIQYREWALDAEEDGEPSVAEDYMSTAVEYRRLELMLYEQKLRNVKGAQK